MNEGRAVLSADFLADATTYGIGLAVRPPKPREPNAMVWYFNMQGGDMRQFSAEEMIRTVLEGLRGEESIAELC
jgi:hypothetical protein